MSVSANKLPSNWSPDHGYVDEGYFERYPLRTFGTGIHFSLLVDLRIFKKDIDPLCGGGAIGIRVIFHSPIEFPQVTKQYLYTRLGKTVTFKVDPKLIVTMNDTLKLHPQLKKCFSDSERKLRFYKHYTQYNCETECLANFTVTKCGCIRFSSPRTLRFQLNDSLKL